MFAIKRGYLQDFIDNITFQVFNCVLAKYFLNQKFNYQKILVIFFQSFKNLYTCNIKKKHYFFLKLHLIFLKVCENINSSKIQVIQKINVLSLEWPNASKVPFIFDNFHKRFRNIFQAKKIFTELWFKYYWKQN